MNTFKSIDSVWEYLNSIPMFQKSGAKAANFSLDNIRTFCNRMGNPQLDFPSIHIAGTNGKGTTAYLLEQIYSLAEFKTGLFTSPHLFHYNERVRVDKQVISDTEILAFFSQNESLLSEITLSYFEISTALAFWYFAKCEVDIAIVEAGLGGRLDSTNIINPEVSVITSIGLDHQSILGNTLELIAREKSGIIKMDTPVVTGNIPYKAVSVIAEKANEMKAELYPTEKLHPQFNEGVITLNNGAINFKTNFLEAVNKWNIACAWQVSRILHPKFNLNEQTVISAMEEFKGAPARFEKLHPEYDWYFSGAHNEQALSSSLETIQSFKPIQDTVVVFSAMRDKITDDLLAHFSGFKRIYFVEQEGERALKFRELNSSIKAILIEESSRERILNELKTELVIFVGSFYFYPTVKRWTTNV